MSKMGIKDLTKWLAPYKSKITLEEMAGLRMAIDTSTFLYRVVKGSLNWTDAFIDIVKTLRSYRIKTVFVFDGKEIPCEKDAERQRRRDADAKTRAKYEWLKTVTPSTPDLRNELKKRFPNLKIPANEMQLRILLSEKKSRMAISTRSIDDEIMAGAKEILDLLGLFWVEAFGEADPLCVELCCSGKVDGVISSDSDLLTYIGTSGCNLLFISDLDCVAGTATFISKPQLLEECDLTEEEFREFCILLGCDYNDKYRMYGYGPVNAYKKIVKYHSIEELAVGEEIDDETLRPTNYERCRELFTTSACSVKVGANTELNTVELERYLSTTNSRIKIDSIIEAWTTLLEGV